MCSNTVTAVIANDSAEDGRSVAISSFNLDTKTKRDVYRIWMELRKSVYML